MNHAELDEKVSNGFKPYIKRQTTYIQETGEINELPSETVPDMSLTPQELLETYSRGGETPPAFYDEENNWDLKGLDLTEIDMLREQYQQRQETAKKALGELEKERLKILKEEQEEAKKARLEELKKLTQE